ncbi:hypothetical protein STVA_07140 [Allostella vacuolata]|nr:hypothetical protein STVA_07140 [Stella vacuolata]
MAGAKRAGGGFCAEAEPARIIARRAGRRRNMDGLAGWQDGTGFRYTAYRVAVTHPIGASIATRQQEARPA